MDGQGLALKTQDGSTTITPQDAATTIELQVRDLEHARSVEVIDFAVKFMADGGTWTGLRIALGLGHASVDRRWRAVRSYVVERMVPVTEELALLARAQMSTHLRERVNDFLEEVQGHLDGIGSSDEERKLLPPLLKVKLEGLKSLIDENEKAFDAYANLKKVKSLDRAAHGTSIIVQNNYHIQRPGETPKEVTGREEKVSALIETANKLAERK